MADALIPRMTEMADAIKAEQRAVRIAGKMAIEHAIKAGNLLIDAKKKFSHGKWIPWLEANCDMAERTAQSYMRLARNWPKLAPSKALSLADLGLGKILEEIGRKVQPPLKAAAPTLVSPIQIDAEMAQAGIVVSAEPHREAVDVDFSIVETKPNIVTPSNNKAAVPVKAPKPTGAARFGADLWVIENALRKIALEVPEQDIDAIFEAARRLVDKYEDTARTGREARS